MTEKVVPMIHVPYVRATVDWYSGIGNVTLKDGKLFAAPGGQQPLSLVAIDQTTFRPIAFDNFGTVTFNIEVGQTTGCVLKYGGGTMPFKRIEDQ
jgi:hypothetical protein